MTLSASVSLLKVVITSEGRFSGHSRERVSDYTHTSYRCTQLPTS